MYDLVLTIFVLQEIFWQTSLYPAVIELCLRYHVLQGIYLYLYLSHSIVYTNIINIWKKTLEQKK